MHPQRIASIRRAVAALAVALFLLAWLAAFSFGARGRSTSGTAATGGNTTPSRTSASGESGLGDTSPDAVITARS